MNPSNHLRKYTLGAMLLGAAAGCAGRPQILPNSDASLRRSSAQFAADAAKRHPYKADAPRGGEIAARAQVGYMIDQLEVANLSDTDWDDVEVWVNKKYVIYIPKVEKGADRVKVINFRMLFDESGNSFPTDNTKTRIESVEVYKDGKMYDVTTKLAD
ncbi:MAG TPA: hypothetical protein VHD56_12860 [Tepidisphaeraceae bacterium]|nr:hypothetical protein [Tepidisphaeraceae bacterium]